MAETYLWQQIPNQGYGKYGKGIIGPGSSEALERAVNAHAGIPKGTKFPVTDKSMITGIEVLKKPTHINNRYGDFGTDYLMREKDLRLTYGEQPVKHMADRWKRFAAKKGKKTLVDQAGSVDVKLMETTHRDAKTGEFLIGKLREVGKKIDAVKDANIGITIPTPEMTHVLTSEAKAAGKAPTALRPGMVIAQDALGTYTPPLRTVLKKNKPTSAEGKEVFKQLKDFVRKEDFAQRMVEKGRITAERAQELVGKAWKYVQKQAAKMPK